MNTKPKTSKHLKWVDGALWRTLGLRSGEAERNYVDLRKKVEDREHVLYDMDVIDQKSSALLTHVSIMLAVVAFMIPDTSGIWRIALTFELVAFLLVAMLLLRCVDVMGPPFRNPSAIPSKANTVYHHEILLRRGVYQAMLRMVFVLTGSLLVGVVAKSVL